MPPYILTVPEHIWPAHPGILSIIAVVYFAAHIVFFFLGTSMETSKNPVKKRLGKIYFLASQLMYPTLIIDMTIRLTGWLVTNVVFMIGVRFNMNKEELIAELQKIKGNPQIAIGINTAWGKECRAVSGITPLNNHDGHKVDSEPCILEINCDRKLFLSEEQKAAQHREYLHKKYGPLVDCSINDRFWAINGYWIDLWNREKIEQLENKIQRLQKDV